jgi:NAD(P)-dependent dehydrogenase (short-subunit alcohol dehydrogenase family)
MGSTVTTSSLVSALAVPGFALITGGGSGIGRATSLLLAREACSGVAIADVNVDSMATVKKELIEAATNPEFKCITIRVDVRDETSVKAMVAETVKAFGRLDYAVNCAGIGLKKPFAETEIQEWDRMIAINLTGVFTCVKEEILQMMKQEPRTGDR